MVVASRRSLLRACAASIALAPLACGRPARPEREGGRVVVTFWYAYGDLVRKVLLELVARFNAAQSRVLVRAVHQGDYFESLAKLRTALAAGVAPTLSHVVLEVVPYLARAGVLEPLDGYEGARDLAAHLGRAGPAGAQDDQARGQRRSALGVRSSDLLVVLGRDGRSGRREARRGRRAHFARGGGRRKGHPLRAAAGARALDAPSSRPGLSGLAIVQRELLAGAPGDDVEQHRVRPVSGEQRPLPSRRGAAPARRPRVGADGRHDVRPDARRAGRRKTCSLGVCPLDVRDRTDDGLVDPHRLHADHSPRGGPPRRERLVREPSERPRGLRPARRCRPLAVGARALPPRARHRRASARTSRAQRARRARGHGRGAGGSGEAGVRPRARWHPWAMLAPTLALLVVFFIVPIGVAAVAR